MLRKRLQEVGLSETISVASAGSRDYNEGEQVEASTREAAESLNLDIPDDFKARLFAPNSDIVKHDLILVLDKFTAADVLREITVYDTIVPGANFSGKVRLLGSFHPVLKRNQDLDGQDVPDPLYGMNGGEQEVERVLSAAGLLAEACEGVLTFLLNLSVPQEGEPADLDEAAAGRRMQAQLKGSLGDMAPTNWLKPPMLQSKQEVFGGDIIE